MESKIMMQQGRQTTRETTVVQPNAENVFRKTETISNGDGMGTTQNDYQKKKAVFRAYQIIWYILGVIEILLVFRVVLLLLGANTSSGFTSFIYSISNPLASPFAGIFGITNNSGAVFEWSTLIAMVVYAIVAYGIVALLKLVKPTNQEEVENTVDNQ